MREELAIADWVAVKIDAIDPDSFRRIDRPRSTINLEEIWAGLLQFRQIYFADQLETAVGILVRYPSQK